MVARSVEKIAKAGKDVAKAVQSQRTSGKRSSSRGIMPEVAKAGRAVGKAVQSKRPPKKTSMRTKKRATGDPRMPRYV